MGGRGAERGLSERRGDLPTVAPEPQASKLWAQGRQHIMGQPSVGMVGSGWSRGKAAEAPAGRVMLRVGK